MLVIYLLILGICVNYTRNAALTNQELKKYKNLIEGQGLYRADEDVYILTASNYKKQLYGKPYCNIVEFYNSWCGFCRRFQPTWSALGTDIKNWKDRVMISVFDCSDDDNAPICREFEIMAYPTLRYFHENYEDVVGKIGTDVEKGQDVQTHKIELLKQIVREQNEGRARMLPDIVPYAFSDFGHVFDNATGKQYVFLIVQPADNEMLGAELAIDLQSVQSITVKYVLSNNTDIVTRLKQGVFAFSSDAPEVPIFIDVPLPHTRESVLTSVGNFLQPKNILVPPPTSQKDVFTGKWEDVQVPSIDDLQEARERAALRHKIKKMGDVVFQGDLETALRYSLRHEIALSKTISGEKYTALQKYLNVLVKYFPFGPKGVGFIKDLVEKVGRSEGALDGATFASWVSDSDKPENQIFSSRLQWFACDGSLPTFRGYPCGLWKLFHYLLINAAEFNIKNQEANPLEVLEAMLGYIGHFFGCTDCSRHFLSIVDETDMKSVSSFDSAILWLWMAHNSANKRLSGDATEDPEYPKIQYPSEENCPTCRHLDKTWILPEILRYLKTVYNNLNIRYIGSDTRILHLGFDASNTYSKSATTSSIFRDLDLDTSMFFMLYILSFLLIVVLIRLFLKRRRYIKKIYVHDLLGKV